MERLLRGTIVAQWLLTMTAVGLDLALADALPAPLRDFVERDPEFPGSLATTVARWPLASCSRG